MSTTVTGKLENLGQANVSIGTFVRFYLRGAGGNQPRVNGTALIAPTLGNVYYFDFVPNSSGNISGTLWSTRDSTGLLGGDIEVGGVTTAVWYGMVVFVNGKAGPETPIHAKNTATFDISNVTPITTNPVVTAPTGDSTYARLDGGNQPFTANIQSPSATFTGAITTQSENGDLWIGTGTGQYTSMAACNTAAVAGQSCHVPAGWSETFAANLVLKDQVCFAVHGLATINMSTFSITSAHGVRPCIKTLGLNGSTSLGQGNMLYLKYFGSGFAVDLGDATGDTRGGDVEGVFIEITAALANSGGIRRRRIQGAYFNTVVVSGSGANAATQLGWVDDGTGTFTGNNVDINCSSNGTLVSRRFIVGNLNMIYGGNWSTSVAAGICMDFQNAEGNIIKAIDCESTATGLNFANSASVSNNFVWAFLQSNTTDVVYGVASKANAVYNLQAGAMTVTDNSAAGNWNSVIGPAPGFRFNSVGQLQIAGGTAAAPAIQLPNGIGIHQTAAAQVLGITSGSFNFFSFGGGGQFGLRSNAWGCWTASGDSDGTCDTGFSRIAAGVVGIGTGAQGNVAGTIKTAALLSGGAAAGTTGTGACATITTNVGGSLAGSFKCTGVTGAATVTITPGTTAPNGWVCYAQDETTKTNLLQQTGHAPTTCTLTSAANITQNDVFVFTAIAF